MSDQRNLLIAVVLSMVVVFGWQYMVGVPKMQQEQAKQAQVLQQQKLNPAAPPPPGAAAIGQAVGVPRADALAKSSQRASIDTPKLAGSINLTGGRFDDLRLRTYHETPDPKSPEIDLLSPMGSEHPYFAEFGWIAWKIGLVMMANQPQSTAMSKR
jgi:YidC/Oxa1 family membrane protein insertase